MTGKIYIPAVANTIKSKNFHNLFKSLARDNFILFILLTDMEICMDVDNWLYGGGHQSCTLRWWFEYPKLIQMSVNVKVSTPLLRLPITLTCTFIRAGDENRTRLPTWEAKSNDLGWTLLNCNGCVVWLCELQWITVICYNCAMAWFSLWNWDVPWIGKWKLGTQHLLRQL